MANMSNTSNMLNKVYCTQVYEINQPEPLVNAVYKNFVYLSNFPNLSHTRTELKRLLSSTNSIYYLVYDNKNQIIGYLIGEFKTLNDSRRVFYISYLYIANIYRGKGIGKQLMNMIINKMSSIGIRYIMLTCDTKDQKVMNYYTSLGFVPDAVLRTMDRHEIYVLYL
jgi:ribosomal protein S18 acetylase RimI-like enzyme